MRGFEVWFNKQGWLNIWLEIMTILPDNWTSMILFSHHNPYESCAPHTKGHGAVRDIFSFLSTFVLTFLRLHNSKQNMVKIYQAQLIIKTINVSSEKKLRLIPGGQSKIVSSIHWFQFLWASVTEAQRNDKSPCKLKILYCDPRLFIWSDYLEDSCTMARHKGHRLRYSMCRSVPWWLSWRVCLMHSSHGKPLLCLL